VASSATTWSAARCTYILLYRLLPALLAAFVVGGLALTCVQHSACITSFPLCLQVVCKPGSIKPHKKFRGEIYALSKVGWF